MKKFQLILTAILMSLGSSAQAFGVDICFNDPTNTTTIIQNCIGIGETCRTSNLDASLQLLCRAYALGESMSGLSGSNGIIGGRNSLHSDSTYLMAQLIGFSPWQAYQMMMYSEATDQSEYTPFNQQGLQMLTNNQINYCRNNWGASMPNYCLLTTPVMNGIYKFNSSTGGMLLHLHSRYSSNGSKPPEISFPVDYLAPANKPYEVVLTNLREWLFDTRSDACAGGITQEINSTNSPCALTTYTLASPTNFFAPGFSKFAIPFTTILGQLIINAGTSTNVVATNASFQAFITPEDVNYAKVGVFLHVLADRHSHHVCTDNSYFYPQNTGNYTSYYAPAYCAQGNHFLWHAWEQGTTQADSNLSTVHQTMRPALSATYDQLVAYAIHKNIPVNTVNKETLLDDLITVIQIYDAPTRLNSMVTLMESYNVLPLPGHGSAASYSINEWLTRAGAPVHLQHKKTRVKA